MQQKIVTVSSNNGSSNKLHERYLKYRHYYAGIDISGFGGYGRAVYAPLLPVFDRWFERKSLDDIPHIMPLLEEKSMNVVTASVAFVRFLAFPTYVLTLFRPVANGRTLPLY